MKGILCMTAISPIHPGAGSGLGLIDNPVIRERTTQYPFCQASSLKGVLRDYAEQRSSLSSPEVNAIFGPDRPGREREPGEMTEETPADQGGTNSGPGRASQETFQGALVLGEGQLLAMPVRSFKGGFVWLTTPLVLWRLKEALDLAGIQANGGNSQNLQEVLQSVCTATIHEETVYVPRSGKDEICHTIAGNRRVLLEEYALKVEDIRDGDTCHMETLASALKDWFFNVGYLKDLFKERLVVVHENLFRYFVKRATQVEANIAINAATGTTVEGSLRYTEYLPENTLFTAYWELGPNRTPGATGTSLDAKWDTLVPPCDVVYLQLGADETIGKGRLEIRRQTGGDVS